MTNTSARAKRSILVAIDFSGESEQVLAAALDLAAGGEPVEIHALNVVVPSADEVNAQAHPASPRMQTDLQRLGPMLTQALTAALARNPTIRITNAIAHESIGSPAHEIVQLAALLQADMVVVGSHGRRGLERMMLGSTAEKVVRHCGCPVLVVRPKHHAAVALEPTIEPICPDCLQRRIETKGTEPWCARHSEHHPRAHVYSIEGANNDVARPWGFDRQ